LLLELTHLEVLSGAPGVFTEVFIVLLSHFSRVPW